MKLKDIQEYFGVENIKDDYLDMELEKVEVSKNFTLMIVVNCDDYRWLPLLIRNESKLTNKMSAFILRCQLEGIEVIRYE